MWHIHAPLVIRRTFNACWEVILETCCAMDLFRNQSFMYIFHALASNDYVSIFKLNCDIVKCSLALMLNRLFLIFERHMCWDVQVINNIFLCQKLWIVCWQNQLLWGRVTAWLGYGLAKISIRHDQNKVHQLPTAYCYNYYSVTLK